MPSARKTECGSMHEERLRHTSRLACEGRVLATIGVMPNHTKHHGPHHDGSSGQRPPTFADVALLCFDSRL